MRKSFHLDYNAEIKEFMEVMDKKLEQTEMLDLKDEQIQEALKNGIEFYKSNNKMEEIIRWERLFQNIDDYFENLQKHIEELERSKKDEDLIGAQREIKNFQEKMEEVFRYRDELRYKSENSKNNPKNLGKQDKKGNE